MPEQLKNIKFWLAVGGVVFTMAVLSETGILNWEQWAHKLASKFNDRNSNGSA